MRIAANAPAVREANWRRGEELIHYRFLHVLVAVDVRRDAVSKLLVNLAVLCKLKNLLFILFGNLHVLEVDFSWLERVCVDGNLKNAGARVSKLLLHSAQYAYNLDCVAGNNFAREVILQIYGKLLGMLSAPQVFE